MDGVQAAAELRHDLDQTFRSERLPGSLCQMVERGASQHRHHEKWLDYCALSEVPNIEYFDDIRVMHICEDLPFFVKQVERGAALQIAYGLQRHFAAHFDVVGSINDTHAATPDHFFDLVAALDSVTRRHTAEFSVTANTLT